MRKAGYSLQANAKTVGGRQHPERDAQFGYLNTEVAAFQAAGDPVISVDTTKRLRHEVARALVVGLVEPHPNGCESFEGNRDLAGVAQVVVQHERHQVGRDATEAGEHAVVRGRG